MEKKESVKSLNGPKIKRTQKRTERRKRAMKRLEQQLLSGEKTVTENRVSAKSPLTESDKIRMKHELAILKSRI